MAGNRPQPFSDGKVSRAAYDARMGSNRLDDVEVQVHVDGTWWPGWLDPQYWRRDPAGGWEGYVRWTKGPALNYLDHFPAGEIRKV